MWARTGCKPSKTGCRPEGAGQNRTWACGPSREGRGGPGLLAGPTPCSFETLETCISLIKAKALKIQLTPKAANPDNDLLTICVPSPLIKLLTISGHSTPRSRTLLSQPSLGHSAHPDPSPGRRGPAVRDEGGHTLGSATTGRDCVTGKCDAQAEPLPKHLLYPKVTTQVIKTILLLITKCYSN